MKFEKRVYSDRILYLLNSQLHCEDGPAVEWTSGKKEWYQHGKLHRTSGPAVTWPSGTKIWYITGLKHRCDGPAYKHFTGAHHWYINGVDLSSEIKPWFKDTGFNQDYDNWTNEEKLLFKLRWC